MAGLDSIERHLFSAPLGPGAVLGQRHQDRQQADQQKTEDGKKIPNYLYSENEPILGFAGLYEFWADPSLPEDDPARWA